VKNRIYTSLFFGISVAFSITGHTQTKPTHAPVKIISAPHHTKPDNKKKTAATAVNAKPSNKKTPATPKSANKKDPIATTKLSPQKKKLKQQLNLLQKSKPSFLLS